MWSIISAIVIVILLIVCLIFYELRWKRQIKKKWLQITLSIIFSAILMPAVFHIIISWDAQRKEEAINKFRQTVIDSLYDRKVNSRELEELLTFKYKKIFDSSEELSKKWAREFVESIPAIRGEVQTTKIQSSELREKLILKWHPLLKYALKSFDDRAKELAKQSDTEISSTKSVPIVLDNQINQKSAILRTVKFPNGNQLKLEIHTGIVDQGKVTWYPNIIISENFVNGGNVTVFVITIRDKLYELNAGSFRHKEYIEEKKCVGDPLEDQEFLGAINKAFNRAFESAYL